MMTKVVMLTVAGILLMQYFEQRKKSDYSRRIVNRFCEFFEEPDLTMAIEDYYRILAKHGSPDHAFATVLHKGGFSGD